MATFTVSNTADSGPGSLRQAILDANGGADTIVFGLPDNSTIVLADDLPQIDGDLTIDGSGVEGLTISGAGLYRVFWANSGDIEIRDLTIADGLAQGGNGGNGGIASEGGGSGGGGAGLGGGLFVDVAAVTLVRVTLVDNNATGGNSGGSANFPYRSGGGGELYFTSVRGGSARSWSRSAS